VRGTSSSAATPPNLEVPEDNIKEECNEVEPTSTKPETFQCFNIELEHKEEQEEEVEVDLDPIVGFEENRPTFDEPITLVQLGRQPEKCTKIGRITNRLLKKEVERVIIAMQTFSHRVQQTCRALIPTSCVINLSSFLKQSLLLNGRESSEKKGE